jgi:ABC transport system ATP-binding/permease protein
MTTLQRVSPEVLRRVGIFSSLTDEEISALASSFVGTDFAAESVIFSEGDPGEGFYVIESGQVRMVSLAGGEEVVIAHLEAGGFFGEMALLSGNARTATAVATSDAQLWRLSREDFGTVLERHPRVSLEIGRVLAERVARANQKRVDSQAFPVLALSTERHEITIGRADNNDLVIPDPQVGAVHARLRRVDGRWLIRDEGTGAGTYVNHRRVEEAEIGDGDEIWIGTTRIFLDGLTVKSFVGREGINIEARGLGRKTAEGITILDNVSLSIKPGEFVAIVGGSGTGKTTLMHALNGFLPATEGAVYYNGLSLYNNLFLFRPVLGYVPQDDIVHPELTVERTLYYAAKLRLPDDTTETEIRERAAEVLGAVGLSERRHTQVRHLSGGQRKRVSLAVELLSRPTAFYLDEPTSGLDPALEGRMMGLFRSLTDSGALVVVSTHVTQNLGMCDKIAWMARGGRLVFYGSPAEAMRHFGVARYSEVYDLLADDEAVERWSRAFLESPAYRANVKPAEPDSVGAIETAESGAEARESAAGIDRRSSGFLRQLFWLTRRYADVVVRDKQNLALLLVLAPLIAISLLILFETSIFALRTNDGGDARLAMISLHMIGVAAIFLGAANAAREIAKEVPIYARERLVNIGIVPYVLSKVIVLSFFCLVQAAALLGIFALRIELHDVSAAEFVALYFSIVLAAMAGLSMGLLASAVTGNADRAMTILPLIIIPQLIFDGALVPLEQMQKPAELVAYLMISKWFLELSGNITELSQRFGAQIPGSPYQDAFDIDPLLNWLVLGGFIVAFLVATVLVQKRKDLT